MNKLIFTLLLSFSLTIAYSQTPCENGSAGGYPCNQVDFYSHIDNATLAGTSGVEGSDIWGWTDPQSGIEYALMAQTNGTVFIELSDPANPTIVGRLPSHNNKSSAWRDVKVYNNFAFIVADNNSGHGMQVFDLSKLRNVTNPPQNFVADARYTGVSSAHNVVINPSKGLAYIVGARGASNGCGEGGLHIVNISNPLNPTYAGCFDADGYTHDAQVVTYSGPDQTYVGKQIAFNSNENTITIADVSDPSNTSLISKEGYSASAYTHQSWVTEDHRYLISNDELDEINGLVDNTRTLIWDIQDLDNPTLIREYFSDRVAIDHNLYVHDNVIFQSNYQNGVVMLDAKKVGSTNIRELGYFDTFPQGDNTSFNGSWSNYPFFESGILIISDIDNGFFAVKPNIKDVITSHPEFVSCENPTTLNVNTDDQFEVSEYQWQLFDGAHFNDIQDNNTYDGVNSDELTITNESDNLNGSEYRCKVTISTGEIVYSYASNGYQSPPIADFDISLMGNTVTLTNNSTGAQSFEWDFGDESALSSENSTSHSYTECGSYTITLTASSACGNTSSSKEITITKPVSHFSYAVIQEEDESITFSFISDVQNANSILWDFGDGNTSIEENPIHTYSSNGQYEVKLTTSNTCGDSIYTEVLDLDLILSSKNILEQNLKVFPNPFNTELKIEALDNSDELSLIEIYNAAGAKIEQIKAANRTSISTAHWKEGLYLLVFTDIKGRKAVKRVIKD
jgi:choice-of-anchor B domain-containing protein